MAQVGNNVNRFGGEYMVQDCDHMSEIREVQGGGPESVQAEQSQTQGWQQGNDTYENAQQGGSQRPQSR